MNIKQHLIKRIQENTHICIWSPVDFLDLGNRNIVDKTLQRLVKTNELQRIDRGLYDYPKINGLTGKEEPPDYRKIIKAIARRNQIRLLIDGMTCANELGLTNAIPSQVVILTDGRIQPIKIQNLTIKFKYTAASKLYWAGNSGMHIVQSLYWLRDIIKSHNEVEKKRISNKLLSILTNSNQKNVILNDLKNGLYTLPTWMQEFLKKIIRELNDK